MLCRECKTENPTIATHCQSCGTKFSASSTTDMCNDAAMPSHITGNSSVATPYKVTAVIVAIIAFIGGFGFSVEFQWGSVKGINWIIALPIWVGGSLVCVFYLALGEIIRQLARLNSNSFR